MGYCTLILAALPLLGLTASANFANTNQALAWGGDKYCGHGWTWGHSWFHHFGGGCCEPSLGGSCCDQGQGIGVDGYNAGIADAVWDHQQNLAYNPIGSCIPYHSQDYWNNFREGYQHQWGVYQSQNTQQTSNINVENSPGAVINVRQNSGQSNDQGLQPQTEGCCG